MFWGAPQRFPKHFGRIGQRKQGGREVPQTTETPRQGKVLATIYKRPDRSYRLYWRARVDGKPPKPDEGLFHLLCGEAREGDKVGGDLVKGSQVTARSPGQS